MVATYTTVARVVAQLGMVDEDGVRFVASDSPATIPSETEITDFIEDAEGELEHECSTAWKEVTADTEYHTTPTRFHQRFKFGVMIQLKKRYIRTITEVALWNNDDWQALDEEGNGPRDGDYYFDAKQGLLEIYNDYPSAYYENGIRLKYTYGQTSVPTPIRRAVTMLAAAYIIESGLDWVHQLVSSGDSMDYMEKSKIWTERAMSIAKRFRVMPPIPQY